MRTSLARLHVPHHASSWWVGHTTAAVAGACVLVYAAGVLLVLAGRLLF